MKITFVHLGREHLGIEYLSAVLKRAGHKTSLVYDPGLFGKEDNVLYIPFLERIFAQRQKMLEKIQRLNPDLIAFSIYTSTYQWSCEMAKLIKNRMDKKIVFGGIHATLIPEKVIKDDFVDFVIVGEGEYSLLELVENLEAGKCNFDIDNLWYKENGEIIMNGLRPPIVDLDSLPYPDKEIFEKDIRYRDDYMTITQRGCLHNCSYCCESFLNKMYSKGYFRKRGIDSVMGELIYMKKRYDFKEVIFFDGDFLVDKEWLRSFLKRFKREINVPFRCMGYITNFDEEIGRLLKDSGCYCIQFGIQSINEVIRRDVLNRFEKNEQIEKSFKICDELRLKYDVDLMFGLPRESEKDHLSAINYFKQFKCLNRIKCFNLSYFPKLPIIETAKREKMLDADDIKKVEDGLMGDMVHIDSIKDKDSKRIKENFQRFYKILPFLPSACVALILKKKLYRRFYLIPSFIIISLQIILGFKNKDYRFYFWIMNYLYRIKKQLNIWLSLNRGDQ